MLIDLDQELHIGRLTRTLGGVANPFCPFARRAAFRRAGLVASDRDGHRAAETLRQRHAAFAAPSEPAADDLVERMAEGLARAAAEGAVDLGDARTVHAWLAGAPGLGRHPLRPDLVEPATERARARVPRWRRLLDQGGDIAGFALLIGGWAALYAVLCPPDALAAPLAGPAHHVSPFSLMGLGPIAIATALALMALWADRARPAETEAKGDEPVVAPPLVPDLDDLECTRRRADRG